MTQTDATTRQTWERSFTEQVRIGAYNTAAVEAVIRNVAYYLRDREGREAGLHFLEMGCGAGPNLVWLARKGVTVSGVDISPTALALARQNLQTTGCTDRIGQLVEASVTDVPFDDASFDGIIEACVFQHLDRPRRLRAFAEVDRLLRPGGLFVGYMLDVDHTVYQRRASEQVPDDPGTLLLEEGGSRVFLTNLGACHFFRADEIRALMPNFTVVDPCHASYYLPRSEARKRGYDEYRQSMWIVYAVK